MNKINIAIFGGTFDPVHKAHIKIADYAIKHLKLEKFFFVPVFQNPFKKLKGINPQHRVNMLELIKTEKTEVSLFEINRKGKSHTIETLKYFRHHFPEDKYNLILLIGSDNLNKLNKWKDIGQIAKLAQITIFKRTKNINKTNIKKYNAQVLQNDLINLASSDFKKGQLNSVPKKVLEYIGKNHLYANYIAKNILSHKRYYHSTATAHMAAELAKIIKYDAKVAWFAGLMHDITKEWSEEKHRKYLADNLIDGKLIPTFKLHQLTGSLWLKHELKIDNKDIIKAISVHTSLDYEMNPLDKIIYIADKICKGRTFKGVQKLRKLCFEDFELGFKEVVKKTLEFLKSIRNMNAKQINIYEELMK